MQLVRFSKENPNWEKALEGKYGYDGQQKFTLTVIKNVLYVVAMKGCKVSDYPLPTVYDGFMQCSDGTQVPVTGSRLSLNLGDAVSAFGVFQLTALN